VTVDRGFRSCVTGLILGGVPLSAPDSFGLADQSGASVNEADRSTTLLGFFLTLRSFIPALQGNDQSSRPFEPRVPFNERPPRRIFCGGSIAKSASFKRSFIAADRSRDVHFDFRDWHLPCRKRNND